ncbi:MAG: NAD-dependent epimerase/dehydratase family protein [Candidatus Hodarchaeota archaeon]
MEKILLTGITGFIGSHLARKLSSTNDYEIYGLNRHYSGEYPALRQDFGQNVHLITGNLIDHERIRKIILKLQPSYIVHIGAFTPVRFSFESPIEYQHIDYLATINLVHAALEILPHNFKKFIFASTMETYGWQASRNPFSEDLTLHPASPYAVAKVAAEKYIEMAGKAYNLPYIVARPCNTYGRKTNTGFITEYLITSMLQGKTPHIGSPDAVRDLMYVDDHVAAYITALQSPVTNDTFNFGWGSTKTMRELAEILKELIGYSGDIQIGFPDDYPTRPIVEDFLSLDATKAQKKLGWTPKVALEDGLQLTIDYWQKNLPRKAI